MAVFMAFFAPRRTATATATATAHADGYSRLEEGQHSSPQPRARGMSEATWRFVKITYMSCTTVLGIMMLVSMFLSRFVYQDPTMQDPYTMVVCVFMALFVMGTGYVLPIVDRS